MDSWHATLLDSRIPMLPEGEQAQASLRHFALMWSRP